MDCGFRILVLTCSGSSEVEGGFLYGKERSTNRSWGSFYTFVAATIDVALVISSGQEYSPTFNQLGDDWGLPIMSMVMYYLLRTIVQSFSEDDDLVQGSRFWGV